MRILIPVLLAIPLLTSTLFAKSPEIPDDLPEVYQTWLREVELLITEPEVEVFLALSQNYQRDAFIECFWRERDPDPLTARNELREDWQNRLADARRLFGEISTATGSTIADLRDRRAQLLLVNGLPDERLEMRCPGVTWPLELWFYQPTERVFYPFAVIFYKRWLHKWRIYDPMDGTEVLFDDISVGGSANESAGCNMDALGEALRIIHGIDGGGVFHQYFKLVAHLKKPPEPPSEEWAATFASYSTDLPEGTETFDIALELSFPGYHQSRTVVQGLLDVPLAALEAADLRGFRSYNLGLTAEILRGDELFDAFRMSFDFPASTLEETDWDGNGLPLVFQRYLRPGEYRLVVRVDDLNGPRKARFEQQLRVPRQADKPKPTDVDELAAALHPELTRLLEEANAAIAEGEVAIRLVPPIGGLVTGLQRFDTLLAGGERVAEVVFAVDGEPVLSKRSAPFTVELDLGALPRAHRLRATALNQDGAELASDEILVNGSPHRLSVRLVEPVSGRLYGAGVRARVDVQVPAGESLDRLEIYRGDTRIVTLDGEPFVHPIALPEPGEATVIRAVAVLADGTSAEDVAIVNAPDLVEEVQVDFVELYTTVLNREGRTVHGLGGEGFRVFEDGVEQTVERFEQVRDLPIRVAVLLDVSASMEGRLGEARDAAASFFEQVVGPRDRVAAIAFNDRPRLAATFTDRLGPFAEGLAGLRAERGTALYDSLIFALFSMNGLQGQRAILLLSDGVDENSRFSAEEAMEAARRAGVTIYTVGLDLPSKGARTLARFAEQTGGRSFQVRDPSELAAVYSAIAEELRSKYLLAYQSTNGDRESGFRKVEVEVEGRGLEVRTLRGYHP